MHWRYELRKQQLLDECVIDPEISRGSLERLAEFAQPFAACLARQEQRDHVRTYLAGLVSDLKRKNTEAIAYRHDQGRHGLQHFVGSSTWDHRPLIHALAAPKRVRGHPVRSEHLCNPGKTQTTVGTGQHPDGSALEVSPDRTQKMCLHDTPPPALVVRYPRVVRWIQDEAATLKTPGKYNRLPEGRIGGFKREPASPPFHDEAQGVPVGVVEPSNECDLAFRAEVVGDIGRVPRR